MQDTKLTLKCTPDQNEAHVARLDAHYLTSKPEGAFGFRPKIGSDASLRCRSLDSSIMVWADAGVTGGPGWPVAAVRAHDRIEGLLPPLPTEAAIGLSR